MVLTWDDVLRRAITAAGGQNALARRLNMNHNAPRQWMLGIALPTPERYPVLAELAGITPEAVAHVVMAERRRRWEARWALPPRPTPGTVASPAVPPSKSQSVKPSRTRRAKALGLSLALGWGLAATPATAGSSHAADNGAHRGAGNAAQVRVSNEVFCDTRRKRAA